MNALAIALACILIPGGLCIFGMTWLVWRWREPKPPISGPRGSEE